MPATCNSTVWVWNPSRDKFGQRRDAGIPEAAPAIGGLS
jgi:hypothetical protein